MLRVVARPLDSLKLIDDEVERFGGEEFLLLLPDGNMDRLSALAWNICHVIGSRPIATSAGSLSVSMSVGALGIARENSACQVDQVLRKADQLLYQAKREGRNRVVAENFFEGPIMKNGSSRITAFPPALAARLTRSVK